MIDETIGVEKVDLAEGFPWMCAQAIYIAGPITKLGWARSIHAAHTVSRIEGRLVDDGFAVINAYSSVHSWANHNPLKVTKADWMRAALTKIKMLYTMQEMGLLEASILMLSFDENMEVNYEGPYKWEDSDGSVEEYGFTQELGVKAYLWAEDDESWDLVPCNGGEA